MTRNKSLARHGWIGLILIAVAWPLNWLLPGLRTHILFFPLWLGYTLTVDALVLRRRGTSILTRSRRSFVKLFLLSAPAWWLFEVINWRTQNWQYVGRAAFTDVEYVLLASVAFSTVIPAVFETAELVRSFRWTHRLKGGPRLRPTRKVLGLMGIIGAAMLGLLLVWPTYFYPFVWGAAFFLMEPLAAALGRRTLLTHTQKGDWRPVVCLALGALLCGFFWELWNWQAFPKWTYDAPGVNFWHVFEMPLIGFIGYLPFALELHAFASLFSQHPMPLRLGAAEPHHEAAASTTPDGRVSSS